MKLRNLLVLTFLPGGIYFFLGSFQCAPKIQSAAAKLYQSRSSAIEKEIGEILSFIDHSSNQNSDFRTEVKRQIHHTRTTLKKLDFWYRYLEPVSYKLLNGPLPVEWETEVFEKFEKPYKRKGAGLILAELYLEDENFSTDSLKKIIQPSLKALEVFGADSITSVFSNPNHFYFANRLFILNLASIYTTGFECPDTAQLIPELISMLDGYVEICNVYKSELENPIFFDKYIPKLKRLLQHASQSQHTFSNFDRYTFNVQLDSLYQLNAAIILQQKLRSRNYNDYSINNEEMHLFSKGIYTGQNIYGLYAAVRDAAQLAEITAIGKMLFYDPILSGNNARSCASCHKSTEFFTDTAVKSALHFDRKQRLSRNTPSLMNIQLSHLLMLDGKHTQLQEQAIGVITNADEMAGLESEILRKIMSCKTYRKAFKKFEKWVPGGGKTTMMHIVSAITSYAASFSEGVTPFEILFALGPSDNSASIIQGFNIFMGKAQCGTCHFFPVFNGTKPPFISSEFEVIGTPADSLFSKLSADKGRYLINPAPETEFAFRTPTLINVERTAPYMHNGVFNNLDQVINFYIAGGGLGKGLPVSNQTLSSDSLQLTSVEKRNLILFLKALTENEPKEKLPPNLPKSTNKVLNSRKVGGVY